MPYKKLVFASRSRMTEAFEESNLRMWCLLGVMVTAARPIRAAQVDAPSAHLPSSALSRVGSDSPRVLGSGGRLSLSSINFPPSSRSQSQYPIVVRPTPARKSESPLCALYDHEQAEGTSDAPRWCRAPQRQSPAMHLNHRFRGKVCLRVLWEHHGEAKVVARDEA